MRIRASDGVYTATLDVASSAVFHAVPTKNGLILTDQPVKVPSSEVIERSVIFSITDSDPEDDFMMSPDGGNTCRVDMPN